MKACNVLNIGSDSGYGAWAASVLSGNFKTRTMIFDPVSPSSVDLWKGKLTDLLKNVHLVVFTGGEDVDPSFYGHQKYERTYSNVSRDVFEGNVFEIVRQAGIPMFGICRGSQFLWAKLGGTLFQHMTHNGKHKALMTLNSLYHAPFMEFTINSTHHQMADFRSKPEDVEILTVAPQPAPFAHVAYNTAELRFEVITNVPDVEAWYTPTRKTLGIQWHPEMGSCPLEGSSVASVMLTNFMIGEIK